MNIAPTILDECFFLCTLLPFREPAKYKVPTNEPDVAATIQIKFQKFLFTSKLRTRLLRCLSLINTARVDAFVTMG